MAVRKQSAIAGRASRSGCTALLLVGWMLFGYSPAYAEEDDEVVVRGTEAGGFESRAGLANAPREVTDVASLLEPLPGVHVRRFGADDSFATLSIRGSSSNEVAVLLSGVPLTGAADPSLDLASLPLWPGARARVYRSFAPAALGPGSLGGTLALEAPRPGDPERTEVWAAAGSFGEARLRTGDVRATDDRGGRLATALSASRADDDFSYYDPNPPGFVTRQNAGHADVNGLASLALPVHWEDGRDGSLAVTTLAQARHQGVPGTASSYPTPFQELDANRELVSVELTRPAGQGAWIATAWGRRDDLRLRDRAPTVLHNPTHTNDAILATGGSLGWRGRLASDVRVEGRADGSGERFAPGLYVGAAQPAGAMRVAAGAGVDLEWEPRPVTLSASGRFDAWSDHADDGTGGGEVHPTGHAGAEVALGAVTLAAHGGALARPPSFIERYGNRGGFVGDPNLKSESALTADAGARTALRGQAASVRAELVGFGTWADDLIVFVNQGVHNGVKATNIGQARIFGLEAELDAKSHLPGLGFELRGAYTGLLTFNDAECAGAVGCEPPALPGRPAHDFVGDLAYALGPARVRYGFDVLAGMRADLVGNVTVPPRVLQSAGVRVDVPRVEGLRVGLEVRNLFDVRTASYQGILGPVVYPIGDLYQYPLPGRSVLATVRWVQER